MKKRITARILAIISLFLIFTSIFSMLAFASPANIVNDDTAKYFKLYYNTKNGLPDDMVYDIATTADGYMWFATASGLVRYDGETFELMNKYTNSDFLAADIRCFFVDSNNNLWIGTDNDGVICKTSSENKQIVNSEFTSSCSVKDIDQLNDGTIVAATSNGLFFVEKDGKIKELENPDNIYIQAKTITVNKKTNELICITETGKVITVFDKKIVKVEDYKDAENGTITCAYYLRDRIYRIGTSNGVIIDVDLAADKKDWNVIETSFSSINRLYLDSNGSCLVIGNEGIGCIDSKNKYTESTYFNGINANAVCLDFQGNYWLSLNGEGLLQMGKSAFLDVNEEYSLPTCSANCVFKHENILYIGTDTGLLCVDENTGKKVSNELTAALEGKQVNDIKLTLENRIIVATDEDGVYAYGGSKGLKQYTKKDHLVSDSINTICIMQDYYVGLGYNDGLGIDVNRVLVKDYNEENGVAGNVVKIFFNDLTDELLIGTESNGGYRISKEGKVIPFGNTFNGTGSIIKAMLKSNDQKGLWLGCGSILYYCDSDFVRHPISKLNLTHSILDLFHDTNGKLWIITSDKIIVADENNLLNADEELNVDVLSGKDGFVSDIAAKAYNFMDDQGMLYLCTNSGVLKINTNDYKISRSSPRLAINSIIADDKNVAVENDSISLSSDVNRLVISASAISFYIDRDYKLLYKLNSAENYSTVELNETNEIIYTNLNGGENTLEIKLIDSDTNDVLSKKYIVINKEYSVVEVKLFRMFAAFLAVLLIAPLIYLFLSYRIYRNKKKHKRSLAIAEQAMHSFAKTIDAKDPYTKGHSERVAEYSVEIAKRYGVAEERLSDLYYAALLHDIGKIGIPDSILKKPGKFNDEEYEIMKTHTTVGAEILSDMPVIKNIQYGARDHHEKYDGTGYPRGISGNLISFEGRVIGAADAYDAMTTLRGYNNTFTHEQIIKEYQEKAGKQFDPKIAQIVIEMIEDGYFAPPEENTEPAEVEKKHLKHKKRKKPKSKQ